MARPSTGYNVGMLQSGLNIKSLEISLPSTDSPNQAELAACLGAICALMDDAGHTQDVPVMLRSNWQRVARLEGVGKRIRCGGGNLWRISGLALMISMILLVSPKANAADEPEQIALSKSPTQFHPPRPNAKRTFIKVGLSIRSTRLDLEALDGAEVRDAGNGAVMADLPALSQWSINIDNAKNIAFQGKNLVDDLKIANGQIKSTITKVAYFPAAASTQLKRFMLPTHPDNIADGVNGYLVVPNGDVDGNQVLVLNGKLYRGAIWLRPCLDALDGRSETTGISAINIVDLEDYLLSVLPGEMPAGWPLESLKAQAIAARSYAVANIGKHAKEGYDLKATIDDQVYTGVASERATSNRAVADTDGIVLKHEGKPISAFFHSTSGGSTEVAENVWGRPVPYLQMVHDYDDLSPHFSWSKKIKVADLENAFGPEIGQLTSLIVVSRTPSNRVKDALAVGSKGSRFVSGESLRKLFKLPSTNFNVGYKENAYEFAGRGSGHGLGLSQWGAKALAEQGYNAAQILTYYYKDVSVDYLADNLGI